jgi:DNA polymerase III epsilon subunit-like protein
MTIPPRIPNTSPHLNGHVLASVDIETTGRLAGRHEIIQIAVVPLDSEIRPLRGVLPFYLNIAPDHPETAEKQATKIHGLKLEKLGKECVTQWKAADVFASWFDSLELPYNKRLIPLAHNWAFESAFLKNWLGLETMDMIWQSQPRDTMICAAMLNDWYGYFEDTRPMTSISLPNLCKQYGIKQTGKAHDALNDALACAELYKVLLGQFPVKVRD